MTEGGGGAGQGGSQEGGQGWGQYAELSEAQRASLLEKALLVMCAPDGRDDGGGFDLQQPGGGLGGEVGRGGRKR